MILFDYDSYCDDVIISVYGHFKYIVKVLQMEPKELLIFNMSCSFDKHSGSYYDGNTVKMSYTDKGVCLDSFDSNRKLLILGEYYGDK